VKKWFMSAAALSLLPMLAACQSNAGALRPITRGDEIASYDFSTAASFEEGSYSGAVLRVREGAYHIDVLAGDGTLWWGQYGETLTDVVIDVDAEQTSSRPETVYGVMCRVRGSVGQDHPIDPTLAAIYTDSPSTAEATADTDEATAEAAADVGDATAEATIAADETVSPDVTDEATAESTPDTTDEPTDEVTTEATEAATEVIIPDEPSFGDGDGYLFLVQGTGAYAIMRARGRDVQPLVDWTTSDQINQAPGRNHLRAVCVGDYLAFYINDVFMADATDDSFSQGQVGLVAAAANSLGARVQFDNLSVAAPAE
jgi:hypothetical protein